MTISTPAESQGMFAGSLSDRLSVDDDVLLVSGYGAVEVAVGAVVLQQVGICGGIRQIVNGNNFDVVSMTLKDGSKRETTDSSKAVNSDAHWHSCEFTLCKDLGNVKSHETLIQGTWSAQLNLARLQIFPPSFATARLRRVSSKPMNASITDDLGSRTIVTGYASTLTCFWRLTAPLPIRVG